MTTKSQECLRSPLTRGHELCDVCVRRYVPCVIILIKQERYLLPTIHSRYPYPTYLRYSTSTSPHQCVFVRPTLAIASIKVVNFAFASCHNLTFCCKLLFSYMACFPKCTSLGAASLKIHVLWSLNVAPGGSWMCMQVSLPQGREEFTTHL